MRFFAQTAISFEHVNTAVSNMSRMLVLNLVLAGIVAALKMSQVFANCQHVDNIPDPQYVGCFKPAAGSGANLPTDGYTSTDPTFTANDCVSCCLSLSTIDQYYAGISWAAAQRYKCTCGTKSQINGNFERWDGCQTCPGNSNQSCGHGALISIYEAFVLPQGTTDGIVDPLSSERTNERTYSTHRGTEYISIQSSTVSVSTEYTTSMTSKEKTTKVPTNMDGPQTKNNIGIIAGSAVGCGAVLIVAGIIAIVCFRRTRGKKSNDQRTSLALGELNSHASPSQNSASNPPFQSPPVKLEDLYTKPDKKKKKQPPTTPNPDDPSYQDVLPTGAQHQYATVQDDPHPYTAVRDEPNLYDSIQDDPQYATVQKGRKHAPDVETNPLYGRGSVDNTAYDPEGPMSNDRAPSVCEMMDNIIYE